MLLQRSESGPGGGGREGTLGGEKTKRNRFGTGIRENYEDKVSIFSSSLEIGERYVRSNVEKGLEWRPLGRAREVRGPDCEAVKKGKVTYGDSRGG